ncbi:MAG: carbamoyltransferase HypF [Nitrospirota bacterium]|nr:MAG: carbamoyltransferase HypF [Nitrospirota bacterium]
MRIRVSGIVQGVGFRPYVFNLARSLDLCGSVKNTDSGVVIEIKGFNIEKFISTLSEDPPPLADIRSIEVEPVDDISDGNERFIILESADGSGFTLTSPDVAVCSECLDDIMDDRNRRYLYPFTNCTNCGPRLTITEKVPYDRPNTTMKVFDMCPDCRAEYDDPSDRRFHAQPNACPVCGPQVFYESGDGSVEKRGQDAIEEVINGLSEGKIIAIKGIGGFHICCNALNPIAVKKLRSEKRKNNKPFALMADDISTVSEYCYVNELEDQLIRSSARPIVLLKRKKGVDIPDDIAPGIEYLGIMLPYTPLHYLLFKHPSNSETSLKCLIMTSGNRSEEPIVSDNEEARELLADMVDGFLFHDRDIFMKADDSVSSVVDNELSGFPIHMRRARGYVPSAILLEEEGPEVLGVGADMKNTFTLTKGRFAIPSQHIGDMENLESLSFFEEALNNLKSVFRVEPVAFGHDMHPSYYSTSWAIKNNDVDLIAVQHHHAHVASVMAGHKLHDNVIGVVLDGTGYGTDGNLWGGEFMICNAVNFKRMAHFRYIPLVGGESSIRHPWKTAVSCLKEAFGSETVSNLAKIGLYKRVAESDIENILKLCSKQELCTLSSGAGRIFDAVASILNICDVNTFEGEAPMKLEAFTIDGVLDDYPVDVVFADPMEIDFSLMFVAIVNDIINGIDKMTISTRFHNTIISIILRMVLRIKENNFIDKVVLSGGTFQNRYLLSKCIEYLEDAGLEVYVNRKVPCNDAGISLGQAFIAREKVKRGLV